MVTAIRPASGNDWKQEIPNCMNQDDFNPEFNSCLYLIAAGARVGWEKIPKRLPITEQALIAEFRNLAKELNAEFSIVGAFLKTLDPEHLTPNQEKIFISLGLKFYWYACIANANPEVKQFVGQNTKTQQAADAWLKNEEI